MHLSANEVLSMTEDSLKNSLSLEIPEGIYLDYKQALSGTSEKEAKREFLKDVTAFANAGGGNLILGVAEPKKGGPAQMVGLDNGGLACELERLASSSIEPRIPGLK